MTAKKMKHIGLQSHRLKPERENPEEVRFAEAWNRANEEGRILDYLLCTGDQRFTISSSPREVEVAATVIQWLGSPVGQSWLRDLGYERPYPRD
jgi:hypothetical protein